MFKKRYNIILKRFLLGSIFGFYNEFFFHIEWDYHKILGPFIYDDIPILFIFGWGVIISIILSISDKIKNKLNVNTTLIDIILFLLICFPLELIFSKIGLIKYNNFIHASKIGAFLGYIFASFIISRYIRFKE